MDRTKSPIWVMQMNCGTGNFSKMPLVTECHCRNSQFNRDSAMQLKQCSVLWVHGPSHDSSSVKIESLVREKFPIHWVRARDAGSLLAKSSFDHQILVFDMNHPDKEYLDLLRRFRVKFITVPTLLLTSNRSESLLLWLLRLRIWDVLYKPCSTERVIESFELIVQFINTYPGVPRFMAPVCADADKGIPPQLIKYTLPHQKTAPAIHLIENQYGEKVTLCKAACQCRLNAYEFSRAFKREHGVGFREYLLRTRIERAKVLLARPELNVLDVMIAVGFNHASYFSRTFRRYVGVSPGAYRRLQ